MTCSRLRQHGRVSVLAFVVMVAAFAIIAMGVSSTILFDRSILRPIPGAYAGAAADSRAASPSQLQWTRAPAEAGA